MTTMQTDSQDVLDRIKTAQSRPLGDPRFKNLIGLEKSTFAQSSNATSGLTFYDLELGAKFLYPVLTPLRTPSLTITRPMCPTGQRAPRSRRRFLKSRLKAAARPRLRW